MGASRKSGPQPSARLFTEPHPEPSTREWHSAEVDGASRGNPGPAAYAVIIRGADGRIVFETGKYLGRTTNNVAEYYALISALDYAATHNIRALKVRSDSELLVRQMQKTYKVKSADLRPLFERAWKLAQGLGHFAIQHVPREQNRDADALANQVLDRSGGAPDGRESPLESSGEQSWRRQAAEKWRNPLRAVYRDGVLVPEESLDLPEGTRVMVRLTPR